MSKIKPICSYQGGKQRISSKIVEIIKSEIKAENTKFYDLCCGSGAISIEIVEQNLFSKDNIVMVDSSMWGGFWRNIGKGWGCEEIEKNLKKIPTERDNIKPYLENICKSPIDYSGNQRYLDFLVMQAGSFGAKQVTTNKDKTHWEKNSFRNYWQPTATSNRRSPVNPMMPMPETLLERFKILSKFMVGVTGVEGDIQDIASFESNSVIYIDPPYEGTSGYGEHTLSINSFLYELKSHGKLHQKNFLVFVSEGKQLKDSDKSWLISEERKKGGISGNRKIANEEYLSMFKI